jgi:chromosome segregation ATPase
MAKQITKAALQAQVAELTAALEAASAALHAAEQREQANRTLFEEARALWLAQRDKADVLAAQQAAHNAPSRRVAAAMPAWQAERAAVMAKAKAMAMASGRTVRVG